MTRTISLLGALLLAVGGPGCLPGAEDVHVGLTGVELSVSGLEDTDVARVIADAVATEHAAPVGGGALELLITLPPGAHRVSVEVERGLRALCQQADVDLEQGELETLLMDVRTFSACDDEPVDDAGTSADAGSECSDVDDCEPADAGSDGGVVTGDAGEPAEDGGEPAEDAGEACGDEGECHGDAGAVDDAGGGDGDGDGDGDGEPPDGGDGDAQADAGVAGPVFDSLREEVHLADCDGGDCVETTRVKAEGEVSFRNANGEESEGAVGPSDIDALAADVMSEDADRLFAGDDPGCPLVAPPAGDRVYLERRLASAGEDDEVVESVDVTGCTGLAATLRARVAFLRSLALP